MCTTSGCDSTANDPRWRKPPRVICARLVPDLLEQVGNLGLDPVVSTVLLGPVLPPPWPDPIDFRAVSAGPPQDPGNTGRAVGNVQRGSQVPARHLVPGLVH